MKIAVPESLSEALAILADAGEDAHVMAGATSTMLLVGQGLIQPDLVVALHRITGLRGIKLCSDGSIWIGALTTIREVETAALIADRLPGLARAAGAVATIRIRNQATLGGNLAHADPAQDPPPMLMALDAVVEVASTRGMRRIPVAELALDVFVTSLQSDELITGVTVPARASGLPATYLKFLPRTADDYATVSVAAVAGDHGLRVALGGVGPAAVRARAVERAISNGDPVETAAGAVVNDIDPIDDIRGSRSYKMRMAQVWTARALREVLS